MSVTTEEVEELELILLAMEIQRRKWNPDFPRTTNKELVPPPEVRTTTAMQLRPSVLRLTKKTKMPVLCFPWIIILSMVIKNLPEWLQLVEVNLQIIITKTELSIQQQHP